MGLLGDSFDDPKTSAIMALSGGLLRGDFGGGLLGANQAFADARQNAMKQKFMDMQMQNYASEIEQRSAAIAKQKQLQEMTQRLLGGGPSPAAPGQMGSGSFGIVPPPSGMTDMPQPRPAGLAGASVDQIAALHAAGGPDLLNAYKAANEGFERKPGSFYDIPGKGREYVADPTKGFSYQNGRVGLIPGFTDATAGITLATEGPKALLNSAGKVNLRPNADGTQSPVSELSENPTLQNILGNLFPGGAAPRMPQAAPAAAPHPMVPAADQRGADAESIRMIQAELQNPNLPPEQRAGLQREIARLTQAQGQPGFPAPSMIRNPQGYGMTTAQAAQAEATKEGATSAAKLPFQTADHVNQTWLKTSYEPVVVAGNAANDILGNVQVARQSMRNMGGSGWGTEAKAVGASVLQGLGIASDNAKLFAANAETFQNAAMSNLQRVLNAAAGPQTEGDADRAGKTFAQLKNTPQANEFILDMTEAKATRDAMKARFFQQALPIARQKGDLQEVEREWMKRAPSIFSMPSMQRWAGGIK